MLVDVKYVAPGLFEKPTIVELIDGSKISDLVKELIIIFNQPDLFFDYDNKMYTIFVVNGKRVQEDYILESNDQVVIIPPIGGG